MADIAQIGFQANTDDLRDAKASLDALVPSAERVDRAAAKAGKALNEAGRSGENAARGARNAGTAMDQAAAGASSTSGAVNQAARAADVYASAANSAAAANFSMANGFDILTGKANANFAAINANLSRIGAVGRPALDNVRQGIKFTAQEGLNLSRQMSDIGVTMAMGMNPFMIAIQQGPQLLDILQMKAAMTGATIGTVFRAAGASMYAAVAPFLPLILMITAAVGVLAAGFALATRSINRGNDDILAGLNLTEKQLERVKKSGVDTAVTMGDTFTAFFQIIGERLQSAFEGPLSWLRDAWNVTMDFITQTGLNAIKFQVGFWSGAVGAIKAAWGTLPAALGDIAYSAANMVIAGTEWMINKAVGLLNGVLIFANAVGEKIGLGGFGLLSPASIGKLANPFAGATKALGKAVAEGYMSGVTEGMAGVDQLFADMAARARQLREQAIRDAAGDAEKGPKARKAKGAKGASEGEKFADLAGDVAREIAMLEAKTKAVNMTEDAALQLENRQKLLNEASAQGIVLTDRMRAALIGLADQLTAAQIALKNAEGFKAMNDDLDKQERALDQAAARIGLYGEALGRLTIAQELYNDAMDRGLTLNPAQIKTLEKRATEIAAKGETNRHDEFIRDTIDQMDQDRFALERERNELGLTGAALKAYRYETEILMQAKRDHITLTDAEAEAIHKAAGVYGEARQKLDDLKEATEAAKEITKGFFTDFLSGIEQGKSAWEAFGDAALNALNKIINKLLDKVLDQAIDSIFKSMSGNAKGNAFNQSGVMAFARGGAFTDQIVNKPTMFAFARGGALGLMGEAGPEAIMPLHRAPDGSLGVRAKGSTPVINVNVNNYHTISGAVSSQDVVELNRQTAENTKDQLRREIPGILQQFQQDGALA